MSIGAQDHAAPDAAFGGTDGGVGPGALPGGPRGFGLYVHIPYCKSLCPYCDFNSYVQPQPPWETFAAALTTELRARAPAFAGETLKTVYFGGGTPSLAPPWLIDRVLTVASEVFDGAGVREVTLEANPGTVSAEQLGALAAVGVNRISLGWQSTHDRLLRVLGRGHSAADSQAAFRAARSAGFDNISVDLIFAVPGQSAADLATDLAAVTELAPEHVSLYALTYHEGTPYFRWLRKGRLRAVEETVELAMMDQIASALIAADYEHYEISNYAFRGRRALHNSAYWAGLPYLGVGPGAHSFWRRDWLSGWRWESVRAPDGYVRAWSGAVYTGALVEPLGQSPGAPPGLPAAADDRVQWLETLTPEQLFSERMLCGLRVCDGVDLLALRQQFAHSRPALDRLARGEQLASDRGWVRNDAGTLRATPLGWQYADSLAELFF